MEKEAETRIRRVMEQMHCPKDFQCAKDGLDELYRGYDVGLDQYLECLHEECSTCPFMFPFCEAYFCTCELRIYLARKLKQP